MTDITLSRFPNWLAYCVRYLFGPRLIHRLTHGVALLAGLVHWLADRIRYLFGPRLVHRLTHGVRNCSCTSLPDRLADCVFHVSEALLFFVANAVNFFLLYNFFADGFVTGVLLLLVDDILNKSGTTARGSCTRWLTSFAGTAVPASSRETHR